MNVRDAVTIHITVYRDEQGSIITDSRAEIQEDATLNEIARAKMHVDAIAEELQESYADRCIHVREGDEDE